MKALYAPAQGEYGLAERPRPVAAVNEALVKVTHAAICRTDVDIRSGNVDHVRYPVIPGHEFSGVVEECGAECRNVKPGDRVAVHSIFSCGYCTPCRMGDSSSCENYDEAGSKCDGGFAEYCAVPAQHLYILPDHVTLEEASLMEPLTNAVSAVRQSEIESGDKVVVIGPGPIGLMATRVASLAHPSLLVLVGLREVRLAYGCRFGATHLVNASEESAVDAIRKIVGDKGANVVIDCSGSHSSFEMAKSIIGWRGRISLEGTPDMDASYEFSPFHLLHSKSVTLRGITGWVTRDFVAAFELISRGLVDVKPLITHRYRLEEWEAAFDMMVDRQNNAVKVIFSLSVE